MVIEDHPQLELRLQLLGIQPAPMLQPADWKFRIAGAAEHGIEIKDIPVQDEFGRRRGLRGDVFQKILEIPVDEKFGILESFPKLVVTAPGLDIRQMQVTDNNSVAGAREVGHRGTIIMESPGINVKVM